MQFLMLDVMCSAPFQSIPSVPQDPIFGVTQAFQADPREKKWNLCVGVYRTASGQPHVFEAIQKAHESLDTVSCGYLPILGDPGYLEAMRSLVFGTQRVEGMFAQTLGGTGALRILAELVKTMSRPVYIPEITWANHRQLLSQVGLDTSCYRYSSQGEADVSSVKNGSVCLFHASCHNPVGVDPSVEQWKEWIDMCAAKDIVPWFDLAYFGFEQDPSTPLFPIEYCLKAHIPFLIAVSCSKNFGLYGQRVGMLGIVTESVNPIRFYLERLIRTNYSNPPRYGASLVEKVLTTPSLRSLWLEELEGMRSRLSTMRRQIAHELGTHTGYPLDVIAQGNGMFCLLDLKPEVIKTLQEVFGIYVAARGRINLAAIPEQDLPYLIKAFKDVL